MSVSFTAEPLKPAWSGRKSQKSVFMLESEQRVMGMLFSGHPRCWGQVEGKDSMVQGRPSGALPFLLASQALNLSFFVFHDL